MLKRFFFLGLILALAAFGCQQQEKVAIDAAAETAAIKTVLNNYVKSCEAEDMAAYAGNILKDPAMVNFGAFGAPIIAWAGLETVIQGQFDMLSDVKIDVSDMKIKLSSCGDFAWATCLWVFRGMAGENAMELPIRCTWVLQKQGDEWLIAHFHKSIAAA
jgi:ketosteroid isomerase-like protein